MVPRPEPTGSLLETQIPRPAPRLPESETPGLGPSNLCFNYPSRACRLKLEKHWSRIIPKCLQHSATETEGEGKLCSLKKAVDPCLLMAEQLN